jgi:hypothetical protein
MTWAQILIGKPQPYEETCSQRGKPKQDGEPKNDWILAPTYLNAVSIDEFSECQGYGRRGLIAVHVSASRQLPQSQTCQLVGMFPAPHRRPSTLGRVFPPRRFDAARFALRAFRATSGPLRPTRAHRGRRRHISPDTFRRTDRTTVARLRTAGRDRHEWKARAADRPRT